MYRIFHKAWVRLTAYIQGVEIVKVGLQIRLELIMNKCAYLSSNTQQILMMMIIIQFNSFLIINALSRELSGPLNETAQLTNQNNTVQLRGPV